jgi:formate/nitrite transporter FocA (FNT family)
MESWQDFIQVLKSITLGDIIGAICLVLMLYMGLFLALIYQ